VDAVAKRIVLGWIVTDFIWGTLLVWYLKRLKQLS
jgi:hypothetical protein